MTVTESPNGYGQFRIGFTRHGDDPEKLRTVVDQSRNRSAVHHVPPDGVAVAITVDAG